MSKHIKVYSDGGSRGNPGHAAIGYVVEIDGKDTYLGSRYLGITTNNEAEYVAIKEALEYVGRGGFGNYLIDCYLDSELVVRQLQGKYKIKNLNLLAIAQQVMKTIAGLADSGCRVIFTSIPREKNKQADKLVNQALDLKMRELYE